MIEVIGNDGKVFRFQDGTSDDVIKASMDKHYANVVPPVTGAQISQDTAAPVPPPLETVTHEPIIPATPPVQPQPVQPPLVQATYQAPQQPAYHQDYNQDAPSQPPQKDNALKYTIMAGVSALVLLAVTVLLWSTGGVGKKPTPPAPTPAPATSTAFQPTPQPDVRQAIVATQVRKEAKTDALVLREMVPGAAADVLGERTVDGVGWLKVRLDPTTGGEGFVIASHLGPFGYVAPVATVQPVGPIGALETNTLPSAAPLPAPVPSTNGRAVAARTYYVAAQQINLRSAPSGTASILERLSFGEAMTSISQYDTSAGPWLRVRTDSGIVGWAKLSNLSLNPSVNPVEETMVPVERYVPDKPTASLSRSSYATRVTVGFYVQAGAARDDSEVQDVISRAKAASSCVGSEPKVYMSDAFVKTKTRGMALIAYGPFPERYQADAFAAQLRPCIADTFITHQPY